MAERDNNVWLAGVDGCPGGWIVAFGRPDGEVLAPHVVATFAEIALGDAQPAIIAVDVPIGLPKQSPAKGRLAERAVRPLLGDRKSSVFRIPSRSAVEASIAPTPLDEHDRFVQACRIARETSDDGKAFSKQGFYILDKVAEVDTFLRSHCEFVPRVFETHPELAFWRMNGEQPLDEPKKVKSSTHPPGIALRNKLLRSAGIPASALDRRPPKGAAADDMVDVFACLVTAQRIHAKRARCYPESPPCDEHGLPMAIWA